MSSGIYKITLNNRDYIGSAKDIKDRIRRHLGDLKNNAHGNMKLQHAFNKYGVENFSYIILEEVCVLNLIEREQYYLDAMSPYYNICTIAGSSLGRLHSVETKKRLSEMKKGKQPSLGRVLREETKEKIRINAKLRGLHPIFMAASIKANTNRKQSIEEIRKRSLKQMKLSSIDISEIKEQLSCGVKQIDLAKIYNVSQTVISRAKTGKGIYADFMIQPEMEQMEL